jgi:hypothetical protein
LGGGRSCADCSLGAGVGGDAAGGFGDAHAVDLGVGGEGIVETGGKLIGNVLGDELGGGVGCIEGGDLVEALVRKGIADLDEDVVDGVKIAEEPIGVEGVAEDCGFGDEVVPVEGFLGVGDGKRMGGTELVGDGDGVHGLILRWIGEGGFVWGGFGGIPLGE